MPSPSKTELRNVLQCCINVIFCESNMWEFFPHIHFQGSRSTNTLSLFLLVISRSSHNSAFRKERNREILLIVVFSSPPGKERFFILSFQSNGQSSQNQEHFVGIQHNFILCINWKAQTLVEHNKVMPKLRFKALLGPERITKEIPHLEAGIRPKMISNRNTSIISIVCNQGGQGRKRVAVQKCFKRKYPCRFSFHTQGKEKDSNSKIFQKEVSSSLWFPLHSNVVQQKAAEENRISFLSYQLQLIFLSLHVQSDEGQFKEKIIDFILIGIGNRNRVKKYGKKMSNVVSITSLLKTKLDNRHIPSKFEHPNTEEKFSPMPMSYMEDDTEEVETVTGKP